MVYPVASMERLGHDFVRVLYTPRLFALVMGSSSGSITSNAPAMY